MNEAKVEEYVLDRQLTIYLMVLKISPNLKGYSYIKSCIEKIYKDNSKKINVNKYLYPEVAKEFNVDKSLIDRSMRHAIEVSVKRDGIRDFERFASFEFDRDKPTPKDLISLLAEKAKLDKGKYLKKFYDEISNEDKQD